TRSVEFVSQFPAHGYAIGGVSVGETRMQMKQAVRFTAPRYSFTKPRYPMGVGTSGGILEGTLHGIDMYDCDIPSRTARQGAIFTPFGRKIIKNAEFIEDFRPLVEGCGCYACQNHTRAYIRHIYRMGEGAASSLLSIHNIYTLVQLAQDA